MAEDAEDMGRYEVIRDIGPRLNEFESMLDQTLAGIDSDHPDRPVLEALAQAWKNQRSAIGDALTNMTASVKEHTENARAAVERVKQELQDQIANLEQAVADANAHEASVQAARVAAAAAASVVPPLPKLDPNLGKSLAQELLAQFGGPEEDDWGPTPHGHDIWEKWWDTWEEKPGG